MNPIKRFVYKGRHLYNCLYLPEITSLSPLSLNVEINNSCNLNCLMCPRKLIERKRSIITLKMFKRLYEQINAPYVALHGYGEPLLNNDLVGILNYLKRKKARTSITSNFTELKSDMAEPLIHSGLGLLKISLDSHIPSTYETIRGQDALDKVVQNILFFQEEKGRLHSNTPSLRVSYTVQPANYMELEGFIEFVKETLKQNTAFFQVLLFKDSLLENVDIGNIDRDSLQRMLKKSLTIAKKMNVGTNLDELIKCFDDTWSHFDKSTRKKKNKCLKPWLTSFISANGDVKPCDLLGLTDEIMGNVFKEPFEKIWNSRRYRDFRRSIVARCEANDVCRNCSPSSLLELFKYTAFSTNYLKE